VLIRRDGQDWEQAAPARFETEVEFQGLVTETFGQVLATQSDAPVVIVREVVMPDQGKLDILGIDTDGLISVCECKLASNAGARREVLGQVLEYAGQLNGMSFRDFRARVEARLGGDLSEAMATIASHDEWDQDAWADEVTGRLDSGRFRVIIATDAITPTLKQTVLYLNSHTDLPVFAVELQRAERAGVEVLAPTVFAEEQARRKAPSPSSAPTLENADTVVVAATYALADYERTSAYICQPERSFREGVEYLGFYAKRRIEPFFPRVVGFRPNLLFTTDTAARLKATGDPVDALAAEVMETELSYSDTRREPGQRYQIIPLDAGAGFEMPRAIKHEGASAWLRGQRYTSSEALTLNPATTEELRAGGG